MKNFFKKGTTTVQVTFSNKEVKEIVERAGVRSIGSWIKKLVMKEVNGWNRYASDVPEDEQYDDQGIEWGDE